MSRIPRVVQGRVRVLLLYPLAARLRLTPGTSNRGAASPAPVHLPHRRLGLRLVVLPTRAKDDKEATATSAARTGGDRARASLLFPVDHPARAADEASPPGQVPRQLHRPCALLLAAWHTQRQRSRAAAGAGGLFSTCVVVAAAIDDAVSGVGTSSMDTWGDRVIGLARSIGMLSIGGRRTEER